MKQSLLLLAGLASFLAITTVAVAAPPALTVQQQSWLAGSARHERCGWVYLHVEGQPFPRGFQHGYLLAPEIGAALADTRRHWEHETAMDWPWFVAKAQKLFVPKIDAEDLAEIDGIVAGLAAAGRPATREEIVAYNGQIELFGYWWPLERERLKRGPPAHGSAPESCSAFIATGHATADGRIVMGHNTMSGYFPAFWNVILDIRPARGHRILMQGVPGWIHSGTDFFLTDAGLVGTETTIGAFKGFDEQGIPEFVRMRRATQDANSIAEWCAILQRGNNGGYANAWLLGDVNANVIARLELGLKHVAFQQKTDGFLLGSNVAEDLKLLRWETEAHETDIRQSSVARRVRWKQLMRQYAGKIDLELAKTMEADHYDTYLQKETPDGRTLCAHGDLDADPPGGRPPFVPGGTLDAKVVDAQMAKQMSFAARWGSACGRAFDAPAFLEAHPQYDWLEGLLKSRPSQPWTVFRAGEQK